jgi:hypothetical protein
MDWISTESYGLPKKGGYFKRDSYPAIHKDLGAGLACFSDFRDEWHFVLNDKQYDISGVTHWMPLPNPTVREEEA